MAKRAILPAEHLSKESQAFFDVLNDESDFSVVLVSAAFIDACLATLLEKYFIKSSVASNLLDPVSGSLGTFSSRSDACYVLGLISKPLYQNLQTLAQIRNQFAHHHLSLNFSITEVAAKCKEFSYAINTLNLQGGDSSFAGQMEDARNSFVINVVMISQRLIVTALETRQLNPK